MFARFFDERNNYANKSVSDFGNNSERAEAGASVKPIAIVPKKRRYVDSDTDGESHSTRRNQKSPKSVSFATDEPGVLVFCADEPVLTTKNPVEEVNRELPIEESRNKPKDAIDKSRKPVKKKRQYVKKQPKKVSAQRSWNEVPSTPFASEQEVECEKVIELPIEESRNKPKDAIDKSRKTVPWATDEQPVKKKRQYVKKQPKKRQYVKKQPKKRQYVKKQPKKVSAQRSSNEVPSTPFASEQKVECEKVIPLSDRPRSKKVPTNKAIKEKRFWEKTMASDFDLKDYEMLLKESDFTEEQADVIKRSFHLMSRKLHIASTYTDRFMKTHMCTSCQFSISHQCVSIHFTEYVQSNCNVICATSIAPESMNICICGFGFFHSHITKSRNSQLHDLSSINILCLVEHHRSHRISCPCCHMNIVMRNRHKNVCCDFTSWAGIESRSNIQFFKFLEDRLRLSSMSPPNIQELYTCRERCCHVFHRCPENAKPYDDNSTELFPVTTYTRSLVTCSYE